jgi:RNA polymerase sigma-70 factor, ECF subfamily
MNSLRADSSSSHLLTLLNQGGVRELTALFMRSRSHIRRLVESRLDKRLLARVDASDIVQETFLRATAGMDAYLKSPKVPPIVWLRLIGKHIVAETHRRHFRDKRSPDRENNWFQDGEDLLSQKLVDSMHSIGSWMARREIALKVRDAIKNLSDQDREIIEMRHLEELSIMESAMILELSLEATKKRYYRALTRFRELIADILPNE